jgi:galactonate dehydratase
LKITEIKTYPVWFDPRNLLIVKIETDEGYYGWGESGLVGRELAVQGAVTHFREFLIGQDPMRIGALWQKMYRSQYFEGGRVLTGAIAAIDIALHDLVARKLGVPVYQLLGGSHRERVPCFTTVNMPIGPAAVEEVKGLMQAGWQAIRMCDGFETRSEDPRLYEPRESIVHTAEWLVQLRNEIGRKPVLGIEYHHRLSVAEAATFCQMLPPGTLDFLEEPIRDENPDAYATLRQMTPVPFAIGEEFSSKWAFLPYIERGLTNFARLDICNVGGFTEAMKVAGWCEAHYIDLMPHNPLGPISTAANLHLAAAVPNYAWLEERTRDYHFSPELFPLQPQIDGVTYPVPTAPGLGVEFNEEMAQEHFRFWEPPHFHRRDGSHTNY